MKKLFILLACTFMFTSCYKDRKVIKGQCGVVIDHHIGGSVSARTWLLVIRFQDGVVREVPVTDNAWVNFSRGETVCF